MAIKRTTASSACGVGVDRRVLDLFQKKVGIEEKVITDRKKKTAGKKESTKVGRKNGMPRMAGARGEKPVPVSLR